MRSHSRSLGGLNMGTVVRAPGPDGPRGEGLGDNSVAMITVKELTKALRAFPADAFVEPYIFRGELHLDIVSADAKLILGVLHTAPTGDVVLSIKYDDPRPRTA